ncbi:MAG: tyrosine-type recombinase/integrase, partial [Alphaproteobacteria bacterium]|nr:tyrosine-type recombinase/integrase [Alphaproteobacteria bacterium]
VRVSEMLGLMPGSFRQREGLVMVTGKGGKERLIPVTDHSLAALANYMTVRKGYFLREGQESRLLFVQRGDAKPQSRTDFWRELKLLAERAGVEPSQVSPHRFRHSCATAMLVGGANLREVQTMLGHSDLVTTEIYTHLAIDQLKELVETHHPLAQTKDEPSQ